MVLRKSPSSKDYPADFPEVLLSLQTSVERIVKQFEVILSGLPDSFPEPESRAVPAATATTTATTINHGTVSDPTAGTPLA